MKAAARPRAAYLPAVALAFLALVWGYNWVVMKVAVQYADPFVFSALRNFLGGLALFAIVALRGGPFRPPLPLWLLTVFAILQTSMSGVTIWALQLGSAGKTSILTYTMPFWILFIAWPVLGERIRGVQWAAVILALGGLVFVLEPWGLRGLAAGLLALWGGICWAIASVLLKVIRRRYQVEILSLTAWHTLIGSIPLVVAAFFTADRWPVWNGTLVAAIVYNVIVASAVAGLLWLYVLSSMPAGVAGISSLAIPVVGVLSAWIQLGERPSTAEAVGTGLIVAALAVMTARGLRAARQTGP